MLQTIASVAIALVVLGCGAMLFGRHKTASVRPKRAIKKEEQSAPAVQTDGPLRQLNAGELDSLPNMFAYMLSRLQGGERAHFPNAGSEIEACRKKTMAIIGGADLTNVQIPDAVRSYLGL